jgi:methionine-rich copper-binding protein CopC
MLAFTASNELYSLAVVKFPNLERTPRSQFRSRSASLLFAGAVLLFISFIFVAVLGKDAYDAHRFASEGRIATATVTKKVVHPASDNGTANTSYEVNYVFTTADGHKVEGSDTVDPDTWEQIADRGPVAVEYAASDPTISRIGIATGVTVIGSILLIVASVLGLVGATLAVKGLLALRTSPQSAGPAASDNHAVPRRGRVAVEQSPLLKVRVSPWIAVGSILLFCGVIFLLIGVLVLHQERLFHAEGVTATAIVLTKSSHVVYNQQNNSHETKYEVGYRFTTQDGRSVQGSNEVGWRTWKSIWERDPIQIVYLPESPARSRLVANDPGMGPWIASVLGGALTAGGILLLGYGFFDATRRHRKGRM